MNQIVAGYGNNLMTRQDLAVEVFKEFALAISQVNSVEQMANLAIPLLRNFLHFDRCSVVSLPADESADNGSSHEASQLYQVDLVYDGLQKDERQASFSHLPNVYDIDPESGGSSLHHANATYIRTARLLDPQTCVAHTAISEIRSVLLSAHASADEGPLDLGVDPLVSGIAIQSLLIVPFISDAIADGALCFAAVGSERFQLSDLEFVEDIALLVASFVRNCALSQRLVQLEAKSGTSESAELLLTDDANSPLKSNVEFLQTIIDNTAAVIFAKSSDGRYLLINREFERIFGVTAEEILGKTDFEVFSESFATQFRNHDLQVIKTNSLLRVEELVPEKEGLRAYFSAKFPLVDKDGEVFGVAGVATDISQLKQVERELREANHFLDSIIEHIPNMIFIKEAKDLRFIKLNRSAEELLGFDREELLGRNDYDFFPEDQADYFTQNDRQVLNDLGILDIPEEPIDTKLRGRRFLHTKKISIVDEDGIPVMLLGISEDITEQREADEELRQAHEQLERKVSERTKELLGLNEELRRHVAEREEVNQFIRKSLQEKELLLKEIHHRVKNNLQVISSLLKLQSRYIEDERARHLFAQSDQRVRSMAMIHERLYRSEGLAEIDLSEYITVLANSLYRTYAIDPERIKLVTDLESVSLGIDQAIPCGLLLNEFFSNSLKHAFGPDEHGTLSVRLEGDDGLIRLYYSDDGCGLPSDFDLASQATLGFEIVRTLVAQLQADFELQTRSPTSFSLCFRRSD